MAMSEVTFLSQYDKAVQEAGKKLFVDSIEVGRSFCSFMITTSVSSIPLYLSIIAYVNSGDKAFLNLDFTSKIIVISPCFAFILSMIIFIIGYLPNIGEINLDNLHKVAEVIQRIVNRRRKIINFGLIIFVFSVLNAIASFIILINKTI